MSLRYRDVDRDRMPGLKRILLNDNPLIGDEGLEHVTEILKEDEWIKGKFSWILIRRFSN